MKNFLNRIKRESFLGDRDFFAKILFLAGILLRAYAFFVSGYLTLDESMVAVYLQGKESLGFLNSGAFIAAVPIHAPGFFFIEKMFALLFTPSELALRLAPFIFSVLSLLFFYVLMKKFFSRRVFFFSLFFFVFSPALIKYSAVVKPYSLSVLVTVVLLFLAETIRREGLRPRFILLLNIAGGLLTYFSVEVVFVLAGINLFFICLFSRAGDWKKVLFIFLSNVFWVSAFGYFYFKFYLINFTIENSVFSMWQEGFLPFRAGAWASLIWTAKIVLHNFRFLTGAGSVTMVFFFLSGFFSAGRKDLSQAWLFGLPVLIVFFAACFQKYPFYERVILFLSPIFFVFIAEGIVWVLGLVARHLHWGINLLVLVAIVFGPLKSSLAFVSQKMNQDDPRQILEVFKSRYHQGDALVINNACQYVYGYYHGRMQIPVPSGFIGILYDYFYGDAIFDDAFIFDYARYNKKGYPQGYTRNHATEEARNKEYYALTHNPRTWLLFIHLGDEIKQKYLKAYWNKGKLLFKKTDSISDLYLWDMSQKEERP